MYVAEHLPVKSFTLYHVFVINISSDNFCMYSLCIQRIIQNLLNFLCTIIYQYFDILSSGGAAKGRPDRTQAYNENIILLCLNCHINKKTEPISICGLQLLTSPDCTLPIGLAIACYQAVIYSLITQLLI